MYRLNPYACPYDLSYHRYRGKHLLYRAKYYCAATPATAGWGQRPPAVRNFDTARGFANRFGAGSLTV